MEVPDDLAADLAALADGRLDPGRRDELERRLAADPDLRAALERQRTAVRVIAAAAADVQAPHDLRIRVDRLRAAPVRRRRWWLPALGLASAAAAAVIVAVGLGGGLDVQGTLAAAVRPAVASVHPVTPGRLAEQVDGVQFPDYQRLGWPAVGQRTDEIDGRSMRTVFYERAGRRVAYTIVSGEALDWPDEGRRVTAEGIVLEALRADGREVVTWRRDGRTCVISGEGVGAQELIELAAWKPRAVA